MFCKRWGVLAVLIALRAPSARAAQGASPFSPWTLEFTPIVGINLPYDIWGTPSTLSVLGLRSAYSINPQASVSLGAMFHDGGVDKGYTVDALFRYEMNTEAGVAFFEVGIHDTYLVFDIDYDELGNCVPSNCQTDSGNHLGVAIGGGVQFPIGPMMPLRLAMHFYKEPTLWLLLEAGIGIRF
jgi:hypothetical protein